MAEGQQQFLAAHPLCVMCAAEGRYTKATVVDHIKPHRGDRNLFWDRANWQPLCKAHHDKKTGLEDSRPTYQF
jgi:5-methylcytosine-specific restriction protein A